jgi:SAM-dependent methyltransferase
MAKRRILPGKNRGGNVVGAARQGRSRPVPGDLWENNGRNGSHPGRLAGVQAPAKDVEKAPPVEAPPQAVAPPIAAPAARPPDPVERPEPEVGVNPECPACSDAHPRVLFEATDRLYHTTTKVFKIVECKECRLIRLEPRPTLKELAAYYPDLYWFLPEGKVGRFAEGYRRFVLRDHLRFVKQAVANSDRTGYVVDVGCGNGLLLGMLPYKKILGLDLSPKAISIAWRQNGVPGACADLLNAPLPPGSCSVVSMFHVLEHLLEPVRYLQAAREILTPGGRLVVQVPNVSCWQFMLFGERWNGLDVPRHLFNFRQRDLISLLDFCGFEVTRRKHFSLRDNPAGLATTLAPGLDPMARRVRQIKEGALKRFLKDGLYFALVLLALPPTLLGAACGAGSTIMIEARKKA